MFFFQAEDGIRDLTVTGVQTCALPILAAAVAILVWGTRRGPRRERWLSAALGLILGGTIGNLYDRLGFGVGRGACRGKGEISVGAGSFKKKKTEGGIVCCIYECEWTCP